MSTAELVSELEGAIGVAESEGAMSESARGDLVGQLRELARGDWAVRVLDAWVAVAVGRSAHLDNHSVAPKFDAVLFSERSVRREYAGPTPDAARLAAAEAVWPELPESVRAELGERP